MNDQKKKKRKKRYSNWKEVLENERKKKRKVTCTSARMQHVINLEAHHARE